jgi:dynein heavy chain, axonemal
LNVFYLENELKEDLKKLYNQLGLDNKPTVFLFTDNHVVEEAFLEFINNMLTTGMVPALYADDEKEVLYLFVQFSLFRSYQCTLNV